MVQPAEEPEVLLARRLRALRKHEWPGHALTQSQLARVLGGLSIGLISSWENESRPVAPPHRHLTTYAQFFATERSIEHEPFRLLRLDELTPAERAHHDQLLDELTNLHSAARSSHATPTGTPSTGQTLWHFPLDQDIVIVCAPLPVEKLGGGPYTNPGHPDYVRMSRFADMDALLELHGHIRSLNPTNRVKCRTSDELRDSDYTAHLVLIGGVDWNEAVRATLRRIEVPVRQKNRPEDEEYGAFVVQEGGTERSFRPKVAKDSGYPTLIEDVAHFYRGPSPYNDKRTVTILNGMFSRGTFGVARALTDGRFRDRNEAYLRTRFAGSGTFSVLTRVPVVNGRVVTPDWTLPENNLHEWPVPSGRRTPEPDDKAG